jgi:hypothetical protein
MHSFAKSIFHIVEMSLSDDVLYRRHDEIVRQKRETYEQLFVKCKNIIRNASRMGSLSCCYEIPPFVLGASHPLIDVKTCAKYIISATAKENPNIRVTFTQPNIVYFDWRRVADED